MDGGISVERDAGIGYDFRMVVLALARLESIDCVSRQQLDSLENCVSFMTVCLYE